MNKQEFLKKVESVNSSFSNISLSNEDYKLIEYVYTWHPCIDAVRGKEQIAYLYCEFGMRIIHDMEDTAAAAEIAEREMIQAKNEYEKAKARWDALKKGAKYL